MHTCQYGKSTLPQKRTGKYDTNQRYLIRLDGGEAWPCLCLFHTNSMRNPAGSAGSSLGRQIRHCHLLTDGWHSRGLCPAQRSPLAGHASSLDCEEFISQENLWISDKRFSILKGKTNSCYKHFSKWYFLGIQPSKEGVVNLVCKSFWG